MELKKYSLSILDRLMLPTILSVEANYVTKIIHKDIEKKVVFTQEEVNKFAMESSGNGGVKWGSEGIDAAFDTEFTDLEVQEIVKSLQAIDSASKLTSETIPLYQKFVLNQ